MKIAKIIYLALIIIIQGYIPSFADSTTAQCVGMCAQRFQNCDHLSNTFTYCSKEYNDCIAAYCNE
jgi:hypothetical protein